MQPSARVVSISEAIERSADSFWGCSSRNPRLRSSANALLRSATEAPPLSLSPLAGRPRPQLAQSLLSQQLGRNLPVQPDHSPATCTLSQGGGPPAQKCRSSAPAPLTGLTPADVIADVMPPRCTSRPHCSKEAMPCFVSARDQSLSLPSLPSFTGASPSSPLPCYSERLLQNQHPLPVDSSRSPRAVTPTAFEEQAVSQQPLRAKILCAVVPPSGMEGRADGFSGESAQEPPSQKSCCVCPHPTGVAAKGGAARSLRGGSVASGDISRAAQAVEAWDAPARPPSLGVLSEPPTPSSGHPHSVLQGFALKYC